MCVYLPPPVRLVDEPVDRKISRKIGVSTGMLRMPLAPARATPSRRFPYCRSPRKDKLYSQRFPSVVSTLLNNRCGRRKQRDDAIIVGLSAAGGLISVLVLSARRNRNRMAPPTWRLAGHAGRGGLRTVEAHSVSVPLQHIDDLAPASSTGRSRVRSVAAPAEKPLKANVLA